LNSKKGSIAVNNLQNAQKLEWLEGLAPVLEGNFLLSPGNCPATQPEKKNTMSQTNATPAPPPPTMLTLIIRWLPLTQSESPQQQKVILGVTLADTEGTTTAPLIQMITAAELGELPSAVLVQLIETAAGVLPDKLAFLQSQKPQPSLSNLKTSKASQASPTLSNKESPIADPTQQLNLFPS
jgi:hypothetical protein